MNTTRRKQRHAKQNSRWPLAIGLFLLLAFGFLSFIFYRIFTLDDFIYVNRTDMGDAEIIGDDFKYKIPADTELASTRGYGKYKLSSLWTLNEKDDGLVAETITKNLFLPVKLWKDGQKGNLSLLQRAKIYLTSNSSVISEDLELDNVPNSVFVKFVDQNFLDFVPRIEIEDLTGTTDTIDRILKIVETIGGKIVLNSKGYDKNFDCEVSGLNLKYVDIFADVLNCDSREAKLEASDVKIKLGAKFADRF